MTITFAEAQRAAQAAISVFAKFGLQCCILGSTACRAYGASREPNDIDIVVLTTQYTQPQLKQILTTSDPKNRFYLLRSKDPFATYHVVWFRLGVDDPGPNLENLSKKCKVDVLLPGIMNIPNVKLEDVVFRDAKPSEGNAPSLPAALLPPGAKTRTAWNGTRPNRSLLSQPLAPPPPPPPQPQPPLPLMPFYTLLLLKLQGWSDHLSSSKSHFQAKVPTDISDIKQLLLIAQTVMSKEDLERARKDTDESVLGDLSKGRVRAWVREFPDTREAWRGLGFEF